MIVIQDGRTTMNMLTVSTQGCRRISPAKRAGNRISDHSGQVVLRGRQQGQLLIQQLDRWNGGERQGENEL